MVGTIYLILILAMVAVLCIAVFFLVRVAVEFMRFRAPARVVCPDTGQLAMIRIDALMPL